MRDASEEDSHLIRRTASSRLARAAALVASVVCALAGCKPKVNTYAPPPPPDVTVAHPIEKTVTRYLENSGVTEPFETVELRARVAGFLEQVNFKPGASVKKGDLLFVIDPRVYEAAARQAEAELSSREATLRLAELTLRRVTDAATSAAASMHEVDRAKAERDQAQAEVALAEAALASAKLNVEFTQVRAPIDGRITKNFVDVGNLVGSGGDPTILATLVSAKPIYVSVDASEANVLRVRRARLAQHPEAEPGQLQAGEWRRVDLATSDSDEFNIHGQIDYVDPALNAQGGTLRVRARFENANEVLLPGLFVRVRIFLSEDTALVVPDIALLTDQSGRYALVVNDKDMVEVRRVTIGDLDGSMRVVLDGLTTADRVIVNGLQRARAGLVVRPTLTELKAVPTSDSGANTAAEPHV